MFVCRGFVDRRSNYLCRGSRWNRPQHSPHRTDRRFHSRPFCSMLSHRAAIYLLIDARLYFRTRLGGWVGGGGTRGEETDDFHRISFSTIRQRELLTDRYNNESCDRVNIFISCFHRFGSKRACITPWSQGPTALSSFALVERYLWVRGEREESWSNFVCIQDGFLCRVKIRLFSRKRHIRLYSGFFRRVYPRHSFREVCNGPRANTKMS